VPLPKEYWDNKKTIGAIFEAIAAATDAKVKAEQVLAEVFSNRPACKSCQDWISIVPGMATNWDNRIKVRG
jgi:hypothetical protein